MLHKNSCQGVPPWTPERRGGSEKRAREAARSDGLLLSYGSRPVDWYRINELKHSVSEERLEQVREIDGEQAYEKMRRAVEKASQEKARQWSGLGKAGSAVGRSGTLAPAASLVLLRGRERIG